MRLENFYILIGETIEYCQRIEYDLKMIYAYMEDGSFSDNLKKVEVLPLGEIIYLIRERDKEQKLLKRQIMIFYSQLPKEEIILCTNVLRITIML